jgi:NADH-quinone oxidoreductase E subunit
MLTSKIREEIKRIQAMYHDRRSAAMGALMAVQRGSGGNLTSEDMEEVARIIGMEPVEINAVAEFYTMYNPHRPVGTYHIQVCRNISCSLLGAEHLIAHMERVLEIKTGETSKDNRFTLSTVECLGSCGTAPMMQVNDDFHENLTVEKIDKLLGELK